MTNKADNKPIDFNKLKPDELMKYEIAKELGLFDKVMETGWKSLSAKETGRIGGLITKKKKEMKQKNESNTEKNTVVG